MDQKKGIYGPNPGDGDRPEQIGWLDRVEIRSAYNRVIAAVDAWEETRAAFLLANFAGENTLSGQVERAARFVEAVAAEENLIAARNSLRGAQSQPPHSPARQQVHASVPQTPTTPDPAPPAPFVASEPIAPIDPRRLHQLAALLPFPHTSAHLSELIGWFTRNGDLGMQWNITMLRWKASFWSDARHATGEHMHLLGALEALANAVLQQANYHGNESERL